MLKKNLIESALKAAGQNKSILFDEDIHLQNPIENNVQRFRFFSELRFMLTFCAIVLVARLSRYRVWCTGRQVEMSQIC